MNELPSPTPLFDHEKLRAYQEALRFAAWVGPVIEALPGKLAARDQLDRASTSVVLNIAEGNGKRSHPDRCRYLDTARGSAVECAGCLDVLVARTFVPFDKATQGKEILLAVVSLVAGLIARFSPTPGRVEEEQAPYGSAQTGAGNGGSTEENENE
jgi:four helix bundle protein